MGRLQPVSAAETGMADPVAQFGLQDAMAVGTAGYTAALCVNALEDWGVIQPGGREVLVTGAAGGVGSTAISLLAARGYRVTAATGRPETRDYLTALGATGLSTAPNWPARARPAKGTLGGRGGFGRRGHAGQCAGPDRLPWRRGGGLRAGGRADLPSGDAPYPAQCRAFGGR